MEVSGSLGKLSHSVAHNAFPKNLLGVVPKDREMDAFPPLSKFSFYTKRPEPILILSSENRLLSSLEDLKDYLIDELNLESEKKATVYFGLSSMSDFWEKWTKENVDKMEIRIEHCLEKYLIECGFKPNSFYIEIEPITMRRIGVRRNMPCNSEFRWKIDISLYDD